jgi:hypothetical protein
LFRVVNLADTLRKCFSDIAAVDSVE